MTSQTKSATLDVDALVDAIQRGDVDGQLAAYAHGAEVTVVDHEHPPGNPLLVRGHDALRARFADIAARDLTHQVRTAALADGHLTLEIACRYGDGTQVACLCVCGIENGQIVWQRGLQAWDH